MRLSTLEEWDRVWRDWTVQRVVVGSGKFVTDQASQTLGCVIKTILFFLPSKLSKVRQFILDEVHFF